jgi:hypothetical protein
MTYPDTTLYPGVDVFPDGPEADPFYFGPARFLGAQAWLGVPPEPLGAGFLLDRLGPSGRLIVEAAFGADLAGDPSGWSWVDLSHDVRYRDGVTCRLGRGDEAATSQPAQLALTLDNRAGTYARGPASPRWPYVRRGVPVRVRINTGQSSPGGEPVITAAWQGYADSWSPTWDVTGRNATVELSASGVLRRMKQGVAPPLSVLRRTLPTQAGVVAYWPCEDEKSASSLASGLPGGAPMAVSGRPAYAQADEKDFPASLPLPLVGDSRWVGNVPAYTPSSGGHQVRFLLSTTDEGIYPFPACQMLDVVWAGGTVADTRVLFYPGDDGQMALRGFDRAGTLLFDSAPTGALHDRPQVVGLDFTQTTATTFAWRFSYHYPGSDVQVYASGTATGVLGRMARITVGSPVAGMLGVVSIGHLTARARSDSAFLGAYSAYAGEYADDRIRRLCEEEAIPIETVGTSLQRMGAQTTDDVLALLRECEDVDGGILHDGTGPGLRYVCRTQRESQQAALVVDVAGGQVARGGLDLVDDDAANRNSVSVKRRGGSTVTVTDELGPEGTRTIGLYDDSVTLAVDSDTRIVDHAGWAVHVGTADGYRLPSLRLDLAAHPELAYAWLQVGPSTRIDLVNVNGVRTQLDDATIGLLCEGWSMALDQVSWKVTANTSAAAPWRVGRLATEVGPPEDGDPDGLQELRAQTDGAYLVSKALVGATTLAVATSAGPLWTVDPTDFPMILDVGGRRVVATGCAGASSPQAFTVEPMIVEAPPGVPVGLWESPVLGL